MGIVWCRESVRDRGIEIAKDNGGTATRSFLVRVDSPSTSLSSIRDQPGVSIGDGHPDDGSLSCERVAVRASDDSGMLYVVTCSYKPDPVPGSSGEGEEGGMDGLTPFWGASSSVSSAPVYKDVDGVVMTNSAGDPLEGLEAERAHFHLTKTEYYISHNDWVAKASDYTNAINGAPWNGGQIGQWKCQGCSAKVNIDRQGAGNAARVYWEVTWDFAFNSDYWRLEPWDIGFNQLVDENGEPVEVYGIGAGSGDADGPCAGGLGRRAILGQDGKPVRQPVALQNGKAKDPCLRPDALLFNVYRERNFGVFGEVTTPQV